MTEADTNLIRAVKRAECTIVEGLLRAGANPNASDTQGWTPLFHAAGTGSTQIMRLLIANGAEIDSGRESGFSPLFSAILTRRFEAVRLLLDAGASPDVTPGGVPLIGHVPSDWKHRDQVINLLRHNSGNRE